MDGQTSTHKGQGHVRSVVGLAIGIFFVPLKKAQIDQARQDLKDVAKELRCRESHIHINKVKSAMVKLTLPAIDRGSQRKPQNR